MFGEDGEWRKLGRGDRRRWNPKDSQRTYRVVAARGNEG